MSQTHRFVFLDTETTGMSHKSGDRIIEIGAVAWINGVEVGQYQQYINPRRPSHPMAFSVHGLSDHFLKDKPDFEDIVESLLNFIDSSTLVIHNASFDVGFINAELQRKSLPPINNPVIDTLKLSRKKLRHLSSHRLDRLCDHFDINREHRVLHGALKDALLLAKIYPHLL